jgi:hypothetical protein
MAVWAKNPITGYGVLFFGVLPESRSDYEIEVIKENDTPTKVSASTEVQRSPSAQINQKR